MCSSCASNWRKAGAVRLSNSKKVVLLAVHSLDHKKWLMVDVGELLELIRGFRTEIVIFERNEV